MLLFLGVLGFISPFAAKGRSQSQPPEGLVEEPRLGAFIITPSNPRDRNAGTAANLDQEFTFKGWVDFPPGSGELWVYVGCDGDSYPGNGILRIRITSPSDTTKTVDGQTVWTFSIGPFKPFREAVDNNLNIWCGRPWLDGGTARVGIVAYRYSDGASDLLPFLDGDGVRLENHDLIFADGSPDPTTQGQYDSPLFQVPAYLGRNNKTGTPNDTTAYYGSVSVDPDGKDSDRTISKELPTFKDFKKRYFDSLSSCNSSNNLRVDDPPAIYFNRGDLGIGREMHCSYNACTAETACYVKNYGRDDGSAFFSYFDDKTASKQAIDVNKPFATVAMVSRGQMAAGAANKVFFAVYLHQGRYDSTIDPLVVQDNSPLALEAPLDERRYNTFIPGNCLVCHGALGSYSTEGKEVFNAHFLPFDLQHGIDYYATDSLSRAAQEARFKRLNQIVATTDFYEELPNARALLNGFYGAPEGSTDPNDWRASTFQDDWIPNNNWNASDDARQIYRKVVAPYCRTCHSSDPVFHFGNWDDFVNLAFDIRDFLCVMHDQNIMPNAQATSIRFWQSDGRAQFVSRMNAAGCGLESD